MDDKETQEILAPSDDKTERVYDEKVLGEVQMKIHNQKAAEALKSETERLAAGQAGREYISQDKINNFRDLNRGMMGKPKTEPKSVSAPDSSDRVVDFSKEDQTALAALKSDFRNKKAS